SHPRMNDPGEKRNESMNTQITGREFWRGVLTAGGATAIPRWTLAPVAGTAEHVAPLPARLVAVMRRLAATMDLPVPSLVLAAHAKVLSALSGEQDVVTGYAAGPGGRALPCPLTTAPATWRALLRAVAPVEMDVVRHRAFAVDALKRELAVAGVRFETEFDPIDTVDAAPDLADDVVLRVGLTNGAGALRVVYRTDALDAASAERIAGYHLAALESMVADPDAEHARVSLLAPAELNFQHEGLAGRRRRAAGGAHHRRRRPAGGVPHRRARRRARRAHRRLPPRRARVDGRRPGRRARAGEPARPRRAELPARGPRGAAPGAAGSARARAVRGARAPPPRRRRRRAGRPALDVPGAQRAGQPAGSGAAHARAAPRGRGRGGDRAEPRLDGRGPRDLQGGRRVPARRTPLPGRPHREDPVPRGLHAGADRAGQHHHAGRGARHPPGGG